jgi:hypothetical protein
VDFRHTFGFDKSKAENGVWVDLGLDDGSRVRIGKIGSVAYNKALDRHRRPYQKILRLRQDIPLEEAIKLTIQVYADTVVLGWDNLKIDGNTLPYTRENAVWLLTDFPDFRTFVEAHANDNELFQDQDFDADSKNSQSSSSMN